MFDYSGGFCFLYLYSGKCPWGVGTSQALSWVAAVLFAYIVNKIIVFRNFNMHPGYLLKEGSAFFGKEPFPEWLPGS